MRALRGDGNGNTLVSGQPRVRAITLAQFGEALQRLNLQATERVFLRGSLRVTRWPSLFAEAAVFRVAKA